MGLKKRSELKLRFTNGLRPSEKDFADVIDSAFNKRDDQFFGRWRPGLVYHKGDVVIYKRTLWEFQADQDLCSHIPPEPGPDWKSLIVPVGDEDWIIIGDLEESDGSPIVMAANEAVGCVGIGTFHPQARLDVIEDGKSRFLLGPKAAACTAFTLVNLDGEETTYLLTGLDAAAVSWLSDVPGGFVFRHGAASDEGRQDQLDCHDGDVLMVIQPDTGGLVRVGIGTDKPDAMLDITDTRRGQFLFNPEDKRDPVFTIVNLGAESEQNYLASGVGAERAVFVTDAPDGFVFKQGGEYGVFLNEENIDQGRSLVCIAPEGKLGVARTPGDYQLDVNGLIRAYALYLDTDRNNIARPGNPGPLLERLLRLRPVRFEWRVATGFADEGEQLGLIAQEVEEILPQVVRTNDDETKAVAYPSLVAVVIKAVQEQQVVIAQQQEVNARQQEEIDRQQAINTRQQNEINAQQEINRLQQEQIDEQREVNAQQQSQIDALEQQLADQPDLSELVARLEAQQQRLDEVTERVADLQQRLDEQQDLNEQQRLLLEDHTARIEKLEQQLADQPDVSELVERIAAQQAINARQQEQIDALEQRLADQPDVSELVERIAAQQAINAQQQDQIDALEQRLADQPDVSELVERIAAQQAINTTQQTEIAAQQALNARQQDQIDALEQRLADQPDVSELVERIAAQQAINTTQQAEIAAQQALNARQQVQIDAQQALNTRQQGQIAAQQARNDAQQQTIDGLQEQVEEIQRLLEELRRNR